MNVGDQLFETEAPRFVVQGVLEAASHALFPRAREREQVLHLTGVARQRRVHPRPVAEAMQAHAVRVREEPLNAERPILAQPHVRAPQTPVPEAQPRPQPVLGLLGMVPQHVHELLRHAREADVGRDGRQGSGQVNAVANPALHLHAPRQGRTHQAQRSE